MSNQYTYAALLIYQLNQPVTVERVIDVLKVSGFTPDENRVTDMVSRLSSIDIKDALKAGLIAAPVPVVEAKPVEKKVEKPDEQADAAKEAAELDVFKNLFG